MRCYRKTSRDDVAALGRFRVDALQLDANQDDSGFLKYSGLGAVMIAMLPRERNSLRWRPWTRECHVTKRKEAAASPRSRRVGTLGGLDRRLGDAGPVGQPFVCRSSLSRRGGRQ